MASGGADGSQQFIALSKTCGSFDSSAVLVKADEQAIHSRGVRNALSEKILGVQAEQSQPSTLSNSALRRARRVPLESADSLRLTPVLRI